MITGLVCEIDGFNIKIFNEKGRLIDITANEDQKEFLEETEVGDWITLDDGELMEYDPPSEILQVTVKDGKLFVTTTATVPTALPKDLQKKYRNAVWSPWLQFVRDKEFLFAESLLTFAKITAKYAPSSTDDLIFELISLEHLDEENQNISLLETPWSIETFQKNSNQLAIPVGVSVNVKTAISKSNIFSGVCIAKNIPNVVYNPEHQGSQELTYVLWSWELGLVRSLPPASHELGQWYQFLINDKRRAKGQEGLHYTHTTARMQIPIKSRLESEVHSVDDREISSITSHFIFNHDEMESVENRELGDNWAERSKGLSQNACFNDFNLSKVELSPEICQKIIAEIESHRRTQSPDVREALKNENIAVKVKAKLLKNWHKKYTQQGSSIFFAAEVTRISYAMTGETIFE